MDVENDETQTVPSKIVGSLKSTWKSFISRTPQESTQMSVRCRVDAPNMDNSKNNNKNVISESDDSSSDDEPPCRKRRICVEKIFPSNESKRAPWKRRSFESVLNHVRHESLKRKRALMKYKVSFYWRSSPIVTCPPTDPVVPDHLLDRFRAFLRSHKSLTSTMMPAETDNSDASCLKPMLKKPNGELQDETQHSGSELKADYDCEKTKLDVVVKKRQIAVSISIK